MVDVLYRDDCKDEGLFLFLLHLNGMNEIKIYQVNCSTVRVWGTVPFKLVLLSYLFIGFGVLI